MSVSSFKSDLARFHHDLDQTAHMVISDSTKRQIQKAYNDKIGRVFSDLKARGLLGSEAGALLKEVNAAYRKITALKVGEVAEHVAPSVDRSPTSAHRTSTSVSSPQPTPRMEQPQVQPRPASHYLPHDLLQLAPAFPSPADQAMATLIGFQLSPERPPFMGNINIMYNFLQHAPIRSEADKRQYFKDFNEYIFKPYQEALKSQNPAFNKQALKEAVLKTQNLIKTQIKALEEGKKHAYLNWGLGGLAGTAAYLTAGVFGLENPMIRAPLAAAAGYYLVADKPTLDQGVKAFGKSAMIMGAASAIQLASNAVGTSSAVNTMMVTVPQTMQHAIAISQQSSLKGAAKVTAKAAAAAGTGVLAHCAAQYAGAGTMLGVTLASSTIKSTGEALAAPTWSETFKGLGKTVAKAGLSIGVGLTIQAELTYMGIPVLASSAISASVTEGIMSLFGASSKEEALATTVKTAAAVGTGVLTHKAYNLAGADIRECTTEQPCTVPDIMRFYENAGAARMSSMKMLKKREGTAKEQAVEAVKDTVVPVGGSALLRGGMNYLNVPSQIAVPVTTAFTLWRSGMNLETMGKMKEQYQRVGQVIHRSL